MQFLDISIPANSEVSYSVFGNAYYVDFGLFGPNPPFIKTENSSYVLVRQGTFYLEDKNFNLLTFKNTGGLPRSIRIVITCKGEEFKHYN